MKYKNITQFIIQILLVLFAIGAGLMLLKQGKSVYILSVCALLVLNYILGRETAADKKKQLDKTNKLADEMVEEVWNACFDYHNNQGPNDVQYSDLEETKRIIKNKY